MDNEQQDFTIFVSYCSEDYELAESICIQLNNCFEGKIKYYLAKKSILVSEDWKKELKKNIENSQAIISILTKNSISRPWVYVEWSPYWLADKAQFFLLSKDLTESDLIKPMQDLQCIKINEKDSIKQLFEKICEIANIKEIPYVKLNKFMSEIGKITKLKPGNIDSGDTKNFKTREQLKRNPEVHIAGICIKEIKGVIKFLIAKRNPNRDLYPSLYECCGGQLEKNEYFSSGVIRHYLQEMNIKVSVEEDLFHIYSIYDKNQGIIPGLMFLCKHVSGTAKSKNHSEIKWIKEEELNNIPDPELIPTLKKEIIGLLDQYRKKYKIKKPTKR